LYFIVKEKELLGKEIAFTHFAQFADAMVIVTKDKGIFVVDKMDDEVEIYRDFQARQYILKEDYLRKELNELGIITNEEIKEYENTLKEKRKKEEELRAKQFEEREYKEYLRLKEKYESKIE
jgi:hypothetical protein